MACTTCADCADTPERIVLPRWEPRWNTGTRPWCRLPVGAMHSTSDFAHVRMHETNSEPPPSRTNTDHSLSLSHIHKQTDTHVVARCTSQTAVGSPHERLRVSARTHDGQSTRLCRRAYTLHVPKHTPTLPPDSSPRHHPRPHTLLSSVVCVAPCAPTNHALTNTPTPAHNLECAQHLQYNSNSGEMRDVLCGEGGVCPTV